MTNQFDSHGGPQNVGIGEHAIGKQVNATQTVSGDGNISSGTGNITVNGIPPALFAEYAGKLAVTDSALASFFKIMEQEKVPPGDLDSKLREIAGQYKELLARVGDDQAAKQAIEAGDYAKAEKLLDDVANRHSLAAAKAHADNARLQRMQYRHAKAAAYWQKAAALLPEGEKKDRSLYLHNAAFDLDHIARYAEALPLYEQSLRIDQEIGERAGEGATLNNISQIYHAKGDYGTALKYLEQSLVIRREVGDKAGEGTTLNNISGIYQARGDYATALKYLEQSLVIRREIGDRAGEGQSLNNIGEIYRAQGDYSTALKHLEQSLVISQEIGNRAGEGTTLNNISQIYDAKGDYTTALKYLEQSLVISQEIGNRAVEAVTSWNIGLTYEEQGDLAKAEQYMARTVQLEEEIGLPTLDESRKALEAVRAKLKAQ